MTNTQAVLSVEGLQTHFFTRTGVLKPVDDVSFSVGPSETVGIVGESGCGNSMTALSIIQLVPDPPGRIVGGKVTLDGRDLLSMSRHQVEDVRGREISMIFQDPLTALNPLWSVGHQLSEVGHRHQDKSGKAVEADVLGMLERVGLPDPNQARKAYPHQLSGGMRQRVMIAMALLAKPRVLIADEPTTALDATIQAQILRLIRDVKEEVDAAVVLITHDLGVVAEMADRVIVMYAGRIVESAPVIALYKAPAHPYTLGLHRSSPLATGRRRTFETIRGQIPTLPQINEIQGCKFVARCDFATEECEREEPPLGDIGNGHLARCWHYDEVLESQGVAHERIQPSSDPEGRATA